MPWKLLDLAYPFDEGHGESVCSRWQQQTSGISQVEDESYNFVAINEQLAGRAPMDPGARAAIQAAGLTEVSTCEDARRFQQLQTEYLESQPSMALPAEPTDSAEPTTVDKVREGFTFKHPKTVRINRWTSATSSVMCSGVLLNGYAILTSAHCFAGSGSYPITVDYGNKPLPTTCLTVGGCSNRPANNFEVWVDPNYQGSGNVENDLAVAVHWTWDPWEVIGDNSSNYIKMWVDGGYPGSRFWVQGYGANSLTGSGAGTGRRSNMEEKIDWVNGDDRYWYATATQGVGHPCKGDSGSSAINTTLTNIDLSLGVFSNFDYTTQGDACPAIGNKFRYTMLATKFGWMQEVMVAAGEPVPLCWTTIESLKNGSGALAVTQCWN